MRYASLRDAVDLLYLAYYQCIFFQPSREIPTYHSILSSFGTKCKSPQIFHNFSAEKFSQVAGPGGDEGES